MDSLTLEYHLNHASSSTIESNDELILSEMCLYKKLLLLKYEDVGPCIASFLEEHGEIELAANWNNMSLVGQNLQIDIESIPNEALDLKNARANSIAKSALLTGILNEFIKIAKAKNK